ncbi:hypothetical protein RCCS2_01244 [Roseobacter sp. CCS2]|nr:hypothetical protein RCCS2_01244 [Roseobacter sp. CCS2]
MATAKPNTPPAPAAPKPATPAPQMQGKPQTPVYTDFASI